MSEICRRIAKLTDKSGQISISDSGPQSRLTPIVGQDDDMFGRRAPAVSASAAVVMHGTKTSAEAKANANQRIEVAAIMVHR